MHAFLCFRRRFANTLIFRTGNLQAIVKIVPLIRPLCLFRNRTRHLHKQGHRTRFMTRYLNSSIYPDQLLPPQCLIYQHHLVPWGTQTEADLILALAFFQTLPRHPGQLYQSDFMGIFHGDAKDSLLYIVSCVIHLLFLEICQ